MDEQSQQPIGTPAERAQIAALPALSFPADAAVLIDVPASTLDRLHYAGRGPRVFLIGRRRYTTPALVAAWLASLADAAALNETASVD